MCLPAICDYGVGLVLNPVRSGSSKKAFAVSLPFSVMELAGLFFPLVRVTVSNLVVRDHASRLFALLHQSTVGALN